MLKEIGSAAIQGMLGLVVMLGAVAILISFSFSALVWAVSLVIEAPWFIISRVGKWRSSGTHLQPPASSL